MVSGNGAGVVEALVLRLVMGVPGIIFRPCQLGFQRVASAPQFLRGIGLSITESFNPFVLGVLYVGRLLNLGLLYIIFLNIAEVGLRL